MNCLCILGTSYDRSLSIHRVKTCGNFAVVEPSCLKKYLDYVSIKPLEV